MGFVQHILVPAVWVIWLAYWIVSAAGAKETVRQESAGSRASHIVPLILGGIVLGSPWILGRQLERHIYPLTWAWVWSGFALVVIGLGFSIIARIWLGKNWSGMVTLKKDHELIRTGPYAWVRHPIYTGILLAIIGSVLTIDRWRALIGLAVIVAALIRKLMVEERFMTQQFGDAYARYRAEVPALIPFIV